MPTRFWAAVSIRRGCRIDLRKNAGLVYTVGSDLSAGRTRSVYTVQYACDPQNVSKAGAIVIQDLKSMQDASVTAAELEQAKAMMLRRIPLGEASFGAIAGGFISRHDLGLPLDEPTVAAQHYIAVTPEEIQAAFRKWIRPGDFVRVSQGPAPQ